MVKAQPRNRTAQALRDLHRGMNHPCAHTSAACAGSLGEGNPLQPAELSWRLAWEK